MIFIGIDPGLSGALAAISESGTLCFIDDTPAVLTGKRREYLVADMCRLVEKCLAYCRPFKSEPEKVVAAIERVHSMPKQGVASTFTFGMGFGIWRGILAGLQVPVDLVDPTRWKKEILNGMPREKESSRVRAQQLFPGAGLDRKKDHGRADALLIAEWRRRQG